MPSPVGGLGACPQKKNQFCAKNYAILSKFWYFFPILQLKVGDYPPVLKVGLPIPLSPLLRRLWALRQFYFTAYLFWAAAPRPR